MSSTTTRVAVRPSVERLLEGKVTIVTGASRGIGAATAQVLAEAGAAVVLAARDERGIEAVAGRIIASGGEAYAVATDVADERSVERRDELFAFKVGHRCSHRSANRGGTLRRPIDPGVPTSAYCPRV